MHTAVAHAALHAAPVQRPAPWRCCCTRQHGRIRPVVARAAAGDESGAQAQAKVMEQVEASASVIDEMVQEIAREMFLDAAVQHVTDGAAQGGSPSEVVASVVGRRLEQLDTTFLATLDGYIRGASERGAADVAEVLMLVRDEVLCRLSQQLPPEMQLIEAALAAPDGAERLALLKRHALLSTDQLSDPAASGSGSSEGGSSSSQGSSSGLDCLAADLERAVSQVIGDMELMLAVPDRRLLAKLVVLREEVQQLLVEATFLQGGAAEGSPEEAALRLPFRQLGAIPKADAVFLQRLMALGSPQERQALLRHALQEDREKLPETSRGQPTTNFERLRAEAERPQEWVRPGRFMQSLNALQQEMLQPSAEATGDGGAAGPSDVALERLESIRREALAVLLDLAGEGQPYLP